MINFTLLNDSIIIKFVFFFNFSRKSLFFIFLERIGITVESSMFFPELLSCYSCVNNGFCTEMNFGIRGTGRADIETWHF